MNPTAMSGIFGANKLGGSQSPTSGFMPVGSPMGPQSSPQGPQMGQNSIMPAGQPAGPMPPVGPGAMPEDPTQMQPQMPQSPMTQAPAAQRAPIMQPNNNMMLDQLKSGADAPQQVTQQPGTPNANTPGIGMQSTPGFMNMVRSGTNAGTGNQLQQQLQLQQLLG